MNLYSMKYNINIPRIVELEIYSRIIGFLQFCSNFLFMHAQKSEVQTLRRLRIPTSEYYLVMYNGLNKCQFKFISIPQKCSYVNICLAFFFQKIISLEACNNVARVTKQLAFSSVREKKNENYIQLLILTQKAPWALHSRTVCEINTKTIPSQEYAVYFICSCLHCAHLHYNIQLSFYTHKLFF